MGFFQDIGKGLEHLKKEVTHFKLKKFLLKFNLPLVIARNCLVLCIKANLFGLASKMYKAAKIRKSKAWDKIGYDWFEGKLGGKESVLHRAVVQGMKVEYKHHANKHKESKAVFQYMGEDDGYIWTTPDLIPDNILPVAAAPAAGAAALIPKLMSLLKSVGIDKDFVIKNGKKILDKGVDDIGKSIVATGKKEAVKIAENAIKSGVPVKVDKRTGDKVLELVHPEDTTHPQYAKHFPKGVQSQFSNPSLFGKQIAKKDLIIYAVIALLLLFVLFKPHTTAA